MSESNLTRRGFLKEAALIGAAVAAMSVEEEGEAAGPSAGPLPRIRLGRLEVSRLVLGSNPFFGFGHRGEDLDRQMKEYFTDSRIRAVLDAAADQGITAVAAPPYRHWIDLFQRYLGEGGKLKIWIAQPDPEAQAMKTAIADAAKGGAKAIFIQGARVDQEFEAGRLDVLRGWVEHIKSFDLPAGMAAHRPDVHLAAEKEGFPTDFYFQCFFRPDTYRLEDRDKAVEAIRQIEKPVVGYKILAAGRLPAQEAFAFAFRHLRPKDGVCVGIFPKENADMISQDVALTRKLSRPRKA